MAYSAIATAQALGWVLTEVIDKHGNVYLADDHGHEYPLSWTHLRKGDTR